MKIIKKYWKDHKEETSHKKSSDEGAYIISFIGGFAVLIIAINSNSNILIGMSIMVMFIGIFAHILVGFPCFLLIRFLDRLVGQNESNY